MRGVTFGGLDEFFRDFLQYSTELPYLSEVNEFLIERSRVRNQVRTNHLLSRQRYRGILCRRSVATLLLFTPKASKTLLSSRKYSLSSELCWIVDIVATQAETGCDFLHRDLTHDWGHPLFFEWSPQEKNFLRRFCTGFVYIEYSKQFNGRPGDIIILLIKCQRRILTTCS